MKASPPLVLLALLAACPPAPGSDTAVVLTESDSDAESSDAANPTVPVTTTSTVTTVSSTTSSSTTDDSDTSSDTSSDTDSTTDAPCNGDMTCDADETTDTCLRDCGLCILDGACDEALETPHSCPAECPPTACQLDGVLDPLHEHCDDGNLDDDDACTSACALNVCGDGHLFAVDQGGEEACDDGNLLDGDGCSATCTRETLFVFITSQTFQGNIFPALNNKTGLALADAHCQALAAKAGLPGTYRAWLSDSALGPATRFNIPPSYPGAFTRTDGAVIAEGWADLLDGTLAMPIDRDEAGAVLTDTLAWTNTEPNGTPADAQTCMNWSSNNIAHKGQIGANAALDATWTNFDANFCANASRLYCFQIP